MAIKNHDRALMGAHRDAAGNSFDTKSETPAPDLKVETTAKTKSTPPWDYAPRKLGPRKPGSGIPKHFAGI